MNELISVIIPVYKVEEYLERCLNSIINQTYHNLEIILVDDGSPDNCPRICDKFAENDKRIKVLHKENGGLSDARNAGTDICTGKYIIYIDSDDYVELDMIEQLYLTLKENKADVAVSGFLWTTRSYDSRWDGKTIVGSGIDIVLMMLNGYAWMAWGKLFKRELIGENRFKKGILYEDFEFIPRTFLKASKAVYLKKPLYHYYIRKDSIMGKTGKCLHADYVRIAEKNIEIFKEEDILDLYKDQLLSNLFIAIFRDICGQFDVKGRIANPEFNYLIKKLIRKNLKVVMKCRGLGIHYKLSFAIMFTSLHIYGIFYIKLKKLYYIKNNE